MNTKKIFYTFLLTPIILSSIYLAGNSQAFVAENESYIAAYTNHHLSSNLLLASSHIAYIKDIGTV
ncbi:hypothetical protein OAO18_06475 [Francisellaceae bacterium]|nr:hypothetical protein [Francisellaceae bacterium]